MHRSASFHHHQRRPKPLDGRADSLPSDPDGLGPELHQGSEGHTDRDFPTRNFVCCVALRLSAHHS